MIDLDNQATVTLKVEIPEQAKVDKWLASLQEPREFALKANIDKRNVAELELLVEQLKNLTAAKIDVSGISSALRPIEELSKGLQDIGNSAGATAEAVKLVTRSASDIGTTMVKQANTAEKALSRMRKSLETTLLKSDASASNKYSLTGEFSSVYREQYDSILRSIREFTSLDEGESIRTQARSLRDLAKALNDLQSMGAAPMAFEELAEELEALKETRGVPAELAKGFETLYTRLGKINANNLPDVFKLQGDFVQFEAQLERVYDDLADKVAQSSTAINDKVINALSNADTSRFDQYISYFADWQSKIDALLNDQSQPFDARRSQINALMQDLRDYANLISNLSVTSTDDIFASLDNIEKANADVNGLIERITALRQSLRSSTESGDMLGTLQIAQQIEGMDSAIDAFVAAQQKLVQAQTRFNNALGSGLFGTEDSSQYKEAAKSIDQLGDSIRSLTMDSPPEDWLNVRAQIELIRSLQTEMRGVLNEQRLSTRKSALTNDIQIWAQDNATAAATVQDSLDRLLVKIQEVDAQHFSGLTKEFSQLKALAQQNVSDAALELDKANFANQITAWTQSYPAAARVYEAEIKNIREALDSVDAVSFGNLQKQFSNLTQQASLLGLATKSMGEAFRNLIDDFSAAAIIMMLGASIEQAFSRAVDTLKEVDTYLTEISKVSSMTSGELTAMSDEAFESASQYGESVLTYLQGIQEWSRTGMGDAAPELAELSVLAKSAGDMTSEMATSYLVATNAAYQLRGNVEALNAILDGQNQITNRNAVSMEELAAATRVAGAQAATSGIAIDQFSAAVGTMQAVTQQGGSTAGRAFRTIVMNLQQVSGTTDDGEVLDASSFNKVERALHAVGIATSEVKDGMLALRDPMEVLADTAKVVSQLSDDSIEKANVLSALGGKYRATQLAALLDNWDLYEKMLSDYNDDSMGSAAAEAEKTANSWAGSLARLENSFTQFVGNFVQADVVIDIINALNSAILSLDSVLSRFTGFQNLAGLTTFIASFKTVSTLLKGIPFKGAGGSAKSFFSDLTTAFKLFGESSDTLRGKLSELPALFQNIRASAVNAGGGIRIAFSALSTLASAGISMAISAAVSALFTAIDNKVHEAERLAEEAEQSLNDYESALDNAETRRADVEAISGEYIELSGGVSQTGENLTLTNDEYARYIDLSNQLAELLPSAVSGWDANGNAVLNFRDNAALLNSTLEETVNTMTSLADAELVQDAGTILQNNRNRYNQLLYDYNWPNVGITDVSSPDYLTGVSITPDDFAQVMRAIAQATTTQFADMQQASADAFEAAVQQYLPDELRSLASRSNLIGAVANAGGFATDAYGAYDLDALRGYMTSVLSAISLYQEDVSRVANENRQLLTAFARQSVDYASLTSDAQQMLADYIAQMDLGFMNADDFTETAANEWANEIVAAFDIIDGSAGETLAALNEVEASFAAGEANIGEYRARMEAAANALQALGESEQGVPAEIIDSLVDSLYQGINQYEARLQEVLASVGGGKDAQAWLDSLSNKEIDIVYDIVASSDSEYTLEELQAQFTDNLNADRAHADFSIGIYTEDIDTAISKLQALNALLASLRGGNVSLDDILSFATDNPEYGDILNFVADGQIDVAGMSDYLTGLYSKIIDNTYQQIQSEINYMTEDNPSRPQAQAALNILESMFSPASVTNADISNIANGYAEAASAILQASLERSVGTIQNGRWVTGVTSEAVAGLESALDAINIDYSDYIRDGQLYNVNWQQELQQNIDGYLEAFSAGVPGALEKAKTASAEAAQELAQTSYDSFAARINTLTDAYNAMLGDGLSAAQLLEFTETFGSELAEALTGGDTDTLRQALDDELQHYRNYFDALVGLSGEATLAIQALSDALSGLGRGAQGTMGIAEISRELEDAASALDDAQTELDAKVERGGLASAADYTSLIEQSRTVVALNQEMIAAYRDMMANTYEGSEAYVEAADGIRECESAIDDAKSAQAGWNQAIIDAFGYNGASSLLSELSSAMQSVYSQSYGGQIGADVAATLANALSSFGVSPTDYISVDQFGIRVDDAGIRALATDTVQRYIEELRSALQTAAPDERIELEFQLEVLTQAQAELMSGMSELSKLQSGYASLQQQISLTAQAFEEQASGSGLSLETYKALTALNEDFANALEYSDGAMRLNAEAMDEYTDATRRQLLADVELAKAQDAQKYDDNARRIAQLAKGYESVAEAYLRLDNAGRAELTGLLDQNSQLATAIDGYNLLASSLDEATHAYLRWTEAQDSPSPDDWFYAGQSAFEQYEAGLESGKIGRGTQYAQAVDLLFASGDATELGRQYVQRYFDGAEDELGRMETFLNDLVEWGYVERNGDEYLVTNFIDLDELSEQTGLTEFALKSLFQNLQSYGFEFDWFDSATVDVANLQAEIAQIESVVESARQRLGELELKPTLTVDERDEQAALAELVAAYDGWSAKLDPVSLEVELEDEAALEGLDNLKDLADEAISEGYVSEDVELTADVDDVETQLASAQEMIASIQTALAELVLNIVTTDAEAALERVRTMLNELALRLAAIASMVVGTLGAERTTSALNTLSASVQRVIGQVESLSHMSIGTLGASAASNMLSNVLSLLRSINNFQIADKTFTVRSVNITSNMGVASAHGTTNAKPGSTLVGEVKPEILVRDGQWHIVGRDGAEFVNLRRGDIVIDGDNTERLLNGRKGARGQAMASGGQAMASGNLFTSLASGISSAISTVVKKVGEVTKELTSDIKNTVKKDGISGGGGKLPSSSGGSSGASGSSGSSGAGGSSSSSKRPSSSGSSSSGSSSKSEAEAEDLFDWIEVRLDRLTQSIDDMISEADEQLTYVAKNENLASAMDIVSDKIEDTTKAYQEYIDTAEKVAKDGGLSDELKQKIQSGDISIEEYDDDTRELITEYQTWYEKALDVRSALYDLNEQQRELASQKLDNIIDHYDRLNDVLSQQQDYTLAQISLDNAQGNALSEDAYRDLIDAERQKITNTQASISAASGELEAAMASGVIQKGSEEWFDYTGQISEMTTSMLESEQAIAEYEQEIAELRLQSLNYNVEQADNALAELEDEVALREELGQVVNETDYRNQIQAVRDQAEAQKALLAEYRAQLATVEEGSARYYELASEVAGVEGDIRALELAQAQLNRTIAEMPLSRYANALEILEATQDLNQAMMDFHEAQGESLTDVEYTELIKNADAQIANLQQQRAEYEKLLATTQQGSDLWQEYKTQLMDVDEAILSLKTSQEEWNDAIIDLRIDQLEQQRDELEKQNDAYERRIALEKAIQELERAKSQRTIRVYREGVGFVWEADQEAIRDAEEELAERQHEETLAKIDEAIDALEEYKDVNNLYDYLAQRVGNGAMSDTVLSFTDGAISSFVSNALAGTAVSIADRIEAALTPAAQTISHDNDSIIIEKIELHGVQSVDALADAIVRELPNRMRQKLMTT